MGCATKFARRACPAHVSGELGPFFAYFLCPDDRLCDHSRL